MAISKKKKEEIVARATDALREAKSLAFLNFHGLSVGDTTAMRKELRSKGVRYLVTKKTLLRRALSSSGFSGELPELPGEVAMAYSTDELAPAREVYVFEKKHKDLVSVLGGMFEGAYVGREYMLSLALIPSLLTLRGQFVNIINSPIQGLVIALSKIGEKKQS